MSDDQRNLDSVHPKPFDEWLKAHRRGEASLEWADALAEVVRAVGLHRKAGSLTITIEVEPKGRSVVVIDKLKAKIPTADREAAVYFGDATGSLVKDDPLQMSLSTAPKYDPITGEILD